MKVGRSAIAEQSLGAVRVFVQPENDPSEAIEIEIFSFLSVTA